MTEPVSPSFLALSPGRDPLNWSLPVDLAVTVGGPERPTLYGGAGLGAALAAMERTTGRPVIWGSAQYLSFAYLGATLDIEVQPLVEGHQVTQARAVARVGDQEILTVFASLGRRASPADRQWARPPQAPPPEDCPAIVYHWNRRDDDMHARLDVRVVDAAVSPQAGEAHSMFWIRPRDPVAIDSGYLAVLGDFVPTAVGRVTGGRMASLDNTVRLFGQAAGDWVLCDTRLYGIQSGFAHGRMLIYDQAGTLLAYASQSMIVRI